MKLASCQKLVKERMAQDLLPAARQVAAGGCGFSAGERAPATPPRS
jgi:hypothetical protein